MTESSARRRNLFVTALKLAIAVGLLSWLAGGGQLQPARIRDSVLREPGLMAVALLLGMFNISTSAIRWLLLLRAEGIACSVPTALRLTWIGHFWNMVIPGAVSGDAVKMYYIGRLAPERREEAWTTVFADRLIGMAALVSLSTLATGLNFDFMWSRPELQATALTMLAVLMTLSLGGAALALGIGRNTTVADSLRKRLPLVDTLRRAYHSMLRLGRRPGIVLVAFLISFFSHASAVFTTVVIGKAVVPPDQASLDFVQYCVVVPVALFSNAVPLTPGGIGVGEAILDNLFVWSGARAGDGATIMLIYRLMFYVVALIGAALYVLHRADMAPPPADTGRPGSGETSAPSAP
jgi:glycosyltransferase 2 family protein